MQRVGAAAGQRGYSLSKENTPFGSPRERQGEPPSTPHIGSSAPAVKAPSEAAATTESAPKYSIPTGNAPVYRPAQRGETQINIPDFLKNRR